MMLVLSEYSGFLSHSKDMHGVRLIGDSKVAVGVNVSANGYLFLCDRLATCPGCTPPLWDRLQPSCDPELDKLKNHGWIDGS